MIKMKGRCEADFEWPVPVRRFSGRGYSSTMYAEATPGGHTNGYGPANEIPPIRNGCDVKLDGEEGCIHRLAVSPSLRPWGPGEVPAFEMKFLLEEGQAAPIEALLAHRLTLDPHSNPGLGNAYRITTLYCETPDFDVFHGIGIHRRRKYRLRSYGSEPTVFLERKAKRGERVRKRRSAVDPLELGQLSGFQQAEEWTGAWFHRQLVRRRLSPICCITYLRTAYVGFTDEGPLRLTFDRQIHGTASSGWSPAMPREGRQLLADKVVCEFKFRGALPTLFRSAIETLRLTPCGVSKYRRCIEAEGVAGARSRRDA